MCVLSWQTKRITSPEPEFNENTTKWFDCLKGRSRSNNKAVVEIIERTTKYITTNIQIIGQFNKINKSWNKWFNATNIQTMQTILADSDNEHT